MTRAFITAAALILLAIVNCDEVGRILESEEIVSSIQALTRSCDQSDNYVGILNAVHSSLELQVRQNIILEEQAHNISVQKRISDLENQVSNLEYSLSSFNGKSRRDLSGNFEMTDSNVYFSAVRSEVGM